VLFPSSLPGGPTGELNVVAEIKSPAGYAGVRAHAKFGGALKFQPESQAFPRALWAPRAPVALLATLIILLGTVWGAYAYVVNQLIQIRKGNQT